MMRRGVADCGGKWRILSQCGGYGVAENGGFCRKYGGYGVAENGGFCRKYGGFVERMSPLFTTPLE